LRASSMAQQLAPFTAQDRTTAELALVFGVVALSLAAIGLYGVLSYGVARRTAEIAIRIALGARAARVVWMILGATAGLVCAGLALGGALAYAASRSDQQPAIRRRAPGSLDADRRNRPALGGRPWRGLPAGTPRVQARSNDRSALTVSLTLASFNRSTPH
jgi:hypothetical protein